MLEKAPLAERILRRLVVFLTLCRSVFQISPTCWAQIRLTVEQGRLYLVAVAAVWVDKPAQVM